MIQCPRCGGSIQEQSRFCPHCAYDVGQSYQPQAMNYPQAAAPAIACPVCGAVVGAGTQFCPNCSTPVQAGMGYQQPGYQQPGYQQMGYRQPYPLAPAKKSKKSLIIGIVVLAVVGALAGLYLLGSTLMSPANLTKEFLRAMEKGDSDAITKMLARDYKRKASVSTDVANASKWFKDSGGIKDILIDKEDVSENVATINYTVQLGNGTSKSGSTRFVKEDRKWKIYEDQTPIALSTPSEALKSYISYMEKGDAEAALNLVLVSKAPKETRESKEFKASTKQAGDDAAKKAKEKGGVKSVNIKDEKITGDNAELKFTITYGNGTEDKENTARLVKEDGKWKIGG